MTRSGIGALIANTIMEHFKHADASTTPEATLTKTALSPLFLPLALGRLGGAMSTFAQNRANIPKMDQARRLVQSVDPQTRSTLLRSTIQQHFGDLPHATYAQILGKPAVGLLARTVPHMIHAPALALAGGAMGAMAGPLGLAAGSMAGGFLSRKLQNMYERHLNRKLGSVQPPPKEEVQEACSSLGLSNWAQSKKPEVTESQAETLAQRHGGPEADANDWQDGLKVELEHGIAAGDANVTNNHPDMTAKIVKSHMDEDKKYYDKLEQVEKKACRLNAYQTSLAGLSRKMKVSR
jgi:hypothetical protein